VQHYINIVTIWSIYTLYFYMLHTWYISLLLSLLYAQVEESIFALINRAATKHFSFWFVHIVLLHLHPLDHSLNSHLLLKHSLNRPIINKCVHFFGRRNNCMNIFWHFSQSFYFLILFRGQLYEAWIKLSTG